MREMAANKQKALREFWDTQIKPQAVQKLETGIIGFDELLEGGLPKNRVTLVSAGPGCGKTMLLSEFLYRGASEYDQPGVFLTFEERPEDIILNLQSLDWDALNDVLTNEKITFIDASQPKDSEIQMGHVNWMAPILARVEYQIKRIGAKRLVVDNLNSVFLRYSSSRDIMQVRDILFDFTDRIKALGVTTLVSSEQVNHRSSLSEHSVEEFVSEGLIELISETGTWHDVRYMKIRKLRGCSYRSGIVQYDLGPQGIRVYPKIPVDTSVGETSFTHRRQFGVSTLDDCLGGGIPESHTLLAAGNTGAGKTTLAMHFMKEGLENNESVIWVALEEPKKVILKTAKAHGWDLQSFESSNKLTFLTSPLIDIYTDKLLYNILDTISATGATRIIIDSISSLESATLDKETVRSFLLQLNGIAKTLSINVFLTYLSDSNFGAGKGQLLGSLSTNAMRLSSIVDGILLLRYVEQDCVVKKLLNILKLRGSQHDKRIYQYEIGTEGFILGEPFS